MTTPRPTITWFLRACHHRPPTGTTVSFTSCRPTAYSLPRPTPERCLRHSATSNRARRFREHRSWPPGPAITCRSRRSTRRFDSQDNGVSVRRVVVRGQGAPNGPCRFEPNDRVQGMTRCDCRERDLAEGGCPAGAGRRCPRGVGRWCASRSAVSDGWGCRDRSAYPRCGWRCDGGTNRPEAVARIWLIPGSVRGAWDDEVCL